MTGWRHVHFLAINFQILLCILWTKLDLILVSSSIYFSVYLVYQIWFESRFPTLFIFLCILWAKFDLNYCFLLYFPVYPVDQIWFEFRFPPLFIFFFVSCGPNLIWILVSSSIYFSVYPVYQIWFESRFPPLFIFLCILWTKFDLNYCFLLYLFSCVSCGPNLIWIPISSPIYFFLYPVDQIWFEFRFPPLLWFGHLYMWFGHNTFSSAWWFSQF